MHSKNPKHEPQIKHAEQALNESHPSNLTNTLELAKSLIALPSITPHDQGCQPLIADRLKSMGFSIEHLRFGQVDNLWARCGTSAPLVVFAGHTDVVPPGPLEAWHSPPFTPTVRNGYLFGRGAADMKGGLAAMITACEAFLQQSPHFEGSIGFLITSDEEGPAIDGTKKVLATLQARGIIIDYCVVGEPSSEEHLGDIMKVGRRGSLSGHLKIFGEQNHIAYTDQKDNPIHQSFPALSALTSIIWDPEEKLDPNLVLFPKTSFHISNLHAGTHATNVVPGILDCHFNFRFSPRLSPEIIQKTVENLLKQHKIRYELHWELSGLPFLTKDGKLRQVTSEAVHEVLGVYPIASAMGGTSDARFIAETGAEVIELGPCRKTIHALNECVKASDLDQLSLIYQRILVKLLKP